MLPAQRTLFPHFLRLRWRYAGGFTALLMRVGLAASIPLAIRWAINALAAGGSAQELLPIAGWLLALAALKAGFQYQTRRILIGLSHEIESALRRELAGRLLSLPQKFYAEYRVGDVLSRAVNDLNAVRLLVGQGLMYLVETAATFVVVLAVMAATDWRLTCLALLPAPVVSLTVMYFGRKTRLGFQEAQETLSDISAFAQENLNGARIIRAFHQGPGEIARFEQLNHAYFDRNMRLARIWSRYYPQLELLIGSTYVIVLGFGGWQVMRNEISLGSFVMFLTYMAMLTWPMIGFGWVINLIERGAASLERVNELLRYPRLIADGPATDDTIRAIRGDIALERVTVAYPGSDRPALADISLFVPAGTALAIVGPVGSGKTTLLNLIPRLIDPQRGRVLIDGVDLRTIPLATLRPSIGSAPQESFLLSATIRENLAFGAPWASDREIAEAAAVAQIRDEIEAFPQSYDTPVGERGLTLSGGQKQRIALARALLPNPRILLLDDAMSSVDPATERRILDRLRQALRNRTALIVTNRTSAAQLAHSIVVLDRGRIVESGSHEELLSGGGFYAALHRRQQLEAELVRNE